MNPPRNKVRIALLCDNTNRELTYLLLLKSDLELSLNANVCILGSVAEMHRTRLLVAKFKPHVVFISQIVEDSMRELAKYIRDSGSLLYVLPPEVLIIPSLALIYSNPSVKYNHLLDGMFLPGLRMKNLFSNSDINKRKLKVVGTPKVDVVVNESGDQFETRNDFLGKINAPINKKNLFIFTSFVKIPGHYMAKNESFRSINTELNDNNSFVDEARQGYSKAIPQLCRDFREFNIILKPHPLEKDLTIYDVNEPNFFLLKDTSFYNCLNSIDVAIHWSSTVAAECWLRNIKTIQYLPHRSFKGKVSELWPGNPTPNKYSELKKAIKKYEKNKLETKYLKFQKQYLTDNFFKIDGETCDRIVEIIGNDISKKKIVPNYPETGLYQLFILDILEKIIGVYLTRYLLRALLPNFKWKYAVSNFVEIY